MARRVHHQLGEYLNRIGWIAADGFRRYPGWIAMICAISLFGIASASATLAGVLLYVQHLEDGAETLAIGGFELHLDANPGGFYAYAAVLAVLGLLAAGSLYLAEWMISRVTVRYQHVLAERLLTVAADPGNVGWPELLPGEPLRAMSRLIGLGVKLTAFAFRNMLRAILPALTFIVATAALVLVDPMVTAMLVPLTLLYLAPLYFINRGVSRQHSQYMELSPRARAEVSRALRDITDADDPPAEKLARAGTTMQQSIHDQAATLFWQRKLSVFRVQMLNTSFFVICLIGLFVLYGITTRTGDRSWSQFVTYVVALRFSLVGLRQVTARFVKLSRFLPEYRSYTRFVDGAMRLKKEREAIAGSVLPESFDVGTGGERRWNSPGRLTVSRGSLIWVLTDWPLTHINLQAIAARLQRKAKENIDLLGSATIATLRHDGGPGRVLIASDAALETDIAALTHQYELVVIVSRSSSSLLGQTGGQELQARLAGVLVMIDRSIIAAGDRNWLEQHADEIDKTLTAARSTSDGDSEDEAELELDEE